VAPRVSGCGGVGGQWWLCFLRLLATSILWLLCRTAHAHGAKAPDSKQCCWVLYNDPSFSFLYRFAWNVFVCACSMRCHLKQVAMLPFNNLSSWYQGLHGGNLKKKARNREKNCGQLSQASRSHFKECIVTCLICLFLRILWYTQKLSRHLP